MYIYIASCDTRTKEKESKTRLIRDLSENLSVGLFNRLVLQMSEVQIRKRIYTERIVRRLRELSRTLCWCGSFCWQMLGGRYTKESHFNLQAVHLYFCVETFRCVRRVVWLSGAEMASKWNVKCTILPYMQISYNIFTRNLYISLGLNAFVTAIWLLINGSENIQNSE